MNRMVIDVDEAVLERRFARKWGHVSKDNKLIYLAVLCVFTCYALVVNIVIGY